MGCGLKSNKLIGLIVLIVFLIQLNYKVVSCISYEVEVEQVNEIDIDQNHDDDFIPEALRSSINKEVGNYEFSSETKSNFVYYLSGFDYANRPVWIAEAGHWDVRQMVLGGPEKIAEFDRYIRNGIYRGLNSTLIMSTEDEPIEQLVLLVDLDGFDIKRLASIPTVKYVLGLYQKYIAVFTKVQAIYLVNTNFAAELFLNLLKPILGREFEKLEVYGTNRAKWLPIILKNIPRDQVPQKFGGDKDFIPYEFC